jgi:hypothetical protein
MKMQLKQISQGLFSGIALASVILFVGLGLGSMQGWLVILWPDDSILSLLWSWVYSNLKESLFIFIFVFFVWLHALKKLSQTLILGGNTARISYLEHMVDVYAGIFFGIGVIFTAVGMRSALMDALGGIDAQAAAEQGAFVMLQRLVDGGILLALSTTIVGGVGGYLMRITKSFVVGHKLHTYYITLQKQEQEAVLSKLDKIEQHLSVLNKDIT